MELKEELEMLLEKYSSLEIVNCLDVISREYEDSI